MSWNPYLKGLAGCLGLIGAYFLIVASLSGWDFAASQFAVNWYWLLALSAGFGVQIGLFSHIRSVHRERVSAGTVAATGATSGAAMLSCCAHYLTNIVPILGISGLAALVGQYQTEIFGFGVAFNLIGIGYLINKKNAIN